MPLPRPRKLPPRYGMVVVPFLLSVMMTFIVSGISTLRALGPGPEFLRAWPAAWMVSWMVAFPVLLVVLPAVRRLASLVVAPPPR